MNVLVNFIEFARKLKAREQGFVRVFLTVN